MTSALKELFFLREYCLESMHCDRCFCIKIWLLLSKSFSIFIILGPIIRKFRCYKTLNLTWIDFYKLFCHFFPVILILTTFLLNPIYLAKKKTLHFPHFMISLVFGSFNVIILWFWLKPNIICEKYNWSSGQKIWSVV